MNHTNVERAFLLLITGLYVGLSIFNCTNLDEDAYIFFRCAENIRDGFGCVFNPGGERIEVCSSILWLFLLACLGELGFAIPVAAKISGIIIGGLCLFIIYKITRLFTRALPWLIVPALLTSFSLPFVMWNQMGLETPLYTLFFLLLVFVCLDRKLFFYWPVSAALLIAARPEGMLIITCLLPFFYAYRGEHRKTRHSFGIFFVLLCVTIGLRLWYFQDFFPTSFYYKIFPGKYRLGVTYINAFLKDYYFYCLLPPLLYFLVKRLGMQGNKVIVPGLIMVHLLWLIMGGADWKPFFRHFVPVIPLVYIYLSAGAAQLCTTNLKKNAALGAALLFGLVSLITPATRTIIGTEPNYVIENFKRFVSTPGDYLTFCAARLSQPTTYTDYNKKDLQILVGEFIKRNYYQGTVLVYDQMGRVPYAAGAGYQFIDSNGLADKRIAHAYFSERSNASIVLRLYDKASSAIIKKLFKETTFVYSRDDILNYIFGKKPEVILCCALIHMPIFNWLSEDKRFKENYDLKYYMGGVLFFEHKGLSKKALNVPSGLKVYYVEEIFKIFEKRNHPLVESIKEREESKDANS